MVDILLVQPPIRDFYLTAKRTIPYGLASIAAALRQADYEVSILDALATRRMKTIATPPEMAYLAPYYGRPDRSPFSLFHRFRHYGFGFERIAREAAAARPRLAGISALFTPYADSALATAKAIKKALPDCPVVVGGHHATAFPQAIMDCKAVDFVVRGEGEHSMVQLADALFKQQPLEKVAGLVWRSDGSGLTVSAPAVIDDAADFPTPAFDLIDHGFYRRGRKSPARSSPPAAVPLAVPTASVGRRAGRLIAVGRWQRSLRNWTGPFSIPRPALSISRTKT